MDSREAFEKWAKCEGLISTLDSYESEDVPMAWRGWQAALSHAQEQSEPVEDRLADWKFDLCKKIDVVIENEYEGDDDEAAKKAYFALRDHIKNMPSVSPQPAQAGLAEIFHYPECWDTAAYPTLQSSIDAVVHAFKCQECVAPQPAQAGWMPIENPPEKWTEVMVWPHPTDYCMTAEFDGNGWQYSEQDRDGAFWSVCKPTHWMFPPVAPQAQT